MCGSVEIRTVYVGSKQAKAAVISRYVYIGISISPKNHCIFQKTSSLHGNFSIFSD